MASASPTRLPSLRRPARPVSMIDGPLTNIPNLSAAPSTEETSKALKRRSFLTQLSRKPAAEIKTQAGIEEDAEADGNADGKTVGRYGEAADFDESRRRALDEGRRNTSTPTPKLPRPASMIPPRGSSSKTSKTRTHVATKSKDSSEDSGDSRAQALAALEGTAPAVVKTKTALPESAVPRPASTKLPQAPRVGGPAIPSRTTSVKTRAERGRKAGSVSGIQTATFIRIPEERTSPPSKLRSEVLPESTAKRTLNDTSTTQLQRPPSATSRLQPSVHSLQISPPRSSVLSKPRPTSMIVPPSSKPTFNTFQQHYSPAKSALPKPAVPLAKQAPKPSPAPEEDSAIPLEVTKQQIELLQLSLLHQSSFKCMNEYTASAKRRLGRMHTKLRKEYENLRLTELVHQRISNLSALDSWCPDTGLLVENMQILSLVYSDLTALMEEGSKHHDLVSTFELWMHEAEALEPTAFLKPLSESWKAANASLVLKLRSIQRNLRVLPPITSTAEGSGADVVLKACKTLVEDMLKELEVMLKLEKEMMAREKVKVEGETDMLLMAHSDTKEKEAWTPVWLKA